MSARERSSIGRFVIRRRIGEGGMGMVYEALDPRTEATLAVKTLVRRDPGFVYLFKQEFRSLAELVHPNLVLLYELFCEDDEWFFTMEYVEGVSFLQHVWTATASSPSSSDPLLPPTEQVRTVLVPADSTGPLLLERIDTEFRVTDFKHLRFTLLQLAEGVTTLHEAGKLHRDIKPSNILVTPDHRVVLLDFGLAMELDPIDIGSGDHGRGGTIPYMAPEQVQGEKLTPAADWYAVGTLLYQALTGRLPHSGTTAELIRSKLTADPVPPDRLRPELPEDLRRLCVDLMQREPGQRPLGTEVLARLSAGEISPRSPRRAARGARFPLHGRVSELAQLQEALAAVRAGRHIAVYLTGPSGMGKSALIREFLRSAAAQPYTRVLAGRCYEQEFVPYKALDGVVDSLLRWLLEMPEQAQERLLPADAEALARLFPVLRRVPAIGRAGELPITNVQELRQRAFAALRRVLANLSERTVICVFIDDLQWGDQDSAMLLNELLHSPQAPRLLFIGSYRSENVRDSAFLEAVLIPPPAGSLVEERRIEIGPLAPAEALTLARDLLEGLPSCEDDALRLVNEAGGVPYFLEELALYAREHSPERRALISLDDALWLRVEALAPPLRKLLQAVSIFGRPLAVQTALEAASLTGAERYAIAVLEKSKLVRTGRGQERIEIDTFHDRVRTVLCQRLSPDTIRAWHTSLADALENDALADPEALAVHHLAAGRAQRAAPYFIRAAELSVAALAFERAAKQYEAALSAVPWPEEERRQLQISMGDALANAGRAEEAAHVWERALPSDPNGPEALELKRRIGYHYCIAGQHAAGRAVFDEVLRRWHTRLPRTAAAAMLALANSQMRLRRRGLKPGSGGEASERALQHIDVLWSVGSSIAIFDLITGYDFMTRCLQAALDAGEPWRLGRALAFQAALEAARGHAQSSDELLAKCDAISAGIDNPHLLGMLAMGRGIRHGCRSEFPAASEQLERAARIFREQCSGVGWELATTHQWWLYMLQSRGEYAELRRLCSELLREARERRDLFTIANICSNPAPHLCLLDDDPEAALQSLEDAPAGQRGAPHRLLSEISRMHIDIYAGRAQQACERLMRQRWQQAWVSRLMPPSTRVLYTYAIGCCLLSAADAGSGPRHLRAVESCAKVLGRETGFPVAEAFRRVLLAGVAAVRGDTGQALEYCTSSAELLQILHCATLAAVMSRRSGQLRGGENGALAVAEADAFLRSRTMRRPDKVAHTWAPGFSRYS